MKKITSFFFLFFSIYSISQSNLERTLSCKIISDRNDSNGIYILNLQNKKVVVTVIDSVFQFLASVGDTIQINSVNYKTKKIVVKNKDFSANPLIIKLELLANQLDEVTVFKNKKFDTSNMKFTDSEIKIFTPAERKLNAASNLYLAFQLGLSMQTDPIMNAISGRTSTLKKVVALEQKQLAIAQTENYFDTIFFVDELKIPIDYIKGFQFFIVEDSDYVKAIQSKNKAIAQFRLQQLALKYLELITEKN